MALNARRGRVARAYLEVYYTAVLRSTGNQSTTPPPPANVADFSLGIYLPPIPSKAPEVARDKVPNPPE